MVILLSSNVLLFMVVPLSDYIFQLNYKGNFSTTKHFSKHAECSNANFGPVPKKQSVPLDIYQPC